ncbi:MAG: hypothetical protein ACE5HE_07120 [Phycisphaerae bacterium]
MRKTLFAVYAVCVGTALLQGARAQVPGHGLHPPMPDQHYRFYARIERAADPVYIDVAVKLGSSSAAAELTQVVPLPAPLNSIKLKRYLPQATLEQRVVRDPAEGAPSAVRLSVEGPTQSYKRWLIADDIERNRLTSLIGTWRYMSLADDEQRDVVFRQFKNEFTRTPMLTVTRTDGGESRSLRVDVGSRHVVEDLGCTIRIKSFYPDFAIDDKTKKPINRSDRRLNPAALVEVEYRDRKEDRWVFAKFPDYSSSASENRGLALVLDCPAESRGDSADFVIVTIARSRHEVWIRHKGIATAEPLELGTTVKVPGTQYAFSIAEFVPGAKLIEEYRPADGRGGVPALEITTVDQAGVATDMWLAFDRPRLLATALGRMTIGFTSRRAAANEVRP